MLPLARAGLKVVGLEAAAGSSPQTIFLTRFETTCGTGAYAVQKSEPGKTHRAQWPEGPALPRPAYHPMMNGVGGTSLHYSGPELAPEGLGFQGA